MPPATRMSCVVCGHSKRTKLLKCLHCLCLGCLPTHLTQSNEVHCPKCAEVTPSPGPGTPQRESLPDIYAAGNLYGQSADDGGQQKRAAVLLCDECCEAHEEVAVSKCADGCMALLCEIHALSHPLNRSTHKHRLTPISESPSPVTVSSRQPTTVRNCIIHRDRKLQSFCDQCTAFLCELCLKNGHDGDHCVMSVEDAVARIRPGVEASVDNCRSAAAAAAAATTDPAAAADGDFGKVISEAIERVSNGIEELKDRSQDVCEQVKEYFKEIMELVQARESDLLDSLDRLHTANLDPLEKQKRSLEKCQRTHETISFLLSSWKDPYDFLRMANWLEEAANKATVTAEKDGKLCLASKLAFTAPDKSKLTAAIAEVGKIMEAADIDMRRSTITCSTTHQRHLRIEVKAVDYAGQAISKETTAAAFLRVEVVSPNAGIVEYVPVARENGKSLIYTYRPSVTGRHRVTAKYFDRHLSGSPAEVTVMPAQCIFNPDRCHPRIQLSNGNRTAGKASAGNQSVCGAEVFSTGRVELRIRLDNMPGGQVRIFFCNSTSAPLDYFQEDNAIWGWCGGSANKGRPWRGSRLNQPWQSGDVIRLSLDCDGHTLTGRHERTGTEEKLVKVHGDLSLYISMWTRDGKVTIL